MHIHIHQISTDDDTISGQFFEQCIKLIHHSIRELEHHLDHQHINIELYQTHDLPPTMNIQGYTHSPYLISLGINKEIDESCDDLFQSELHSTIVHEIHHTQRWKTVGYGQTFREVLVNEGLACLAEVQANPLHHIPYIQSNNEEIKSLLLSAAQQNNMYNHAERYYGDGTLINRAGYKLGYYLLSLFSQHTGKTARELVNKSHTDILNDAFMKSIIYYDS